MRTFSSEGIILKRVDFGEADRLVTIFTKNKGKITSLAKGIRKMGSRRSGNVELLNKAKLSFVQSKSLPILTEAESVQTFPRLKEDLRKIGLAYYLIELVDQFFHDGQESYKTYDLLSEALNLINELELEKSEIVVRAFELKLLSIVGYQPSLQLCVKCLEKLEPNGNYLSPEAGGLLGRSCVSDNISEKPVSKEEIKLIRFALEKPFLETIKIKVPSNLAEKLKIQMKIYIEYFLERQLYSPKFSESVSRLE